MNSMRLIVLASACVIAAGSIKAMEKMDVDTSSQATFGTQNQTQQTQGTTFGAPQVQGYGPQIGNVQRQYMPLDGYLESLNKVYNMEKDGTSDLGSLRSALFNLESKISKFCNPNDLNVKKILHYIRSFKNSVGQNTLEIYDKPNNSKFLDGIDEPITVVRSSPYQFLNTGALYHR